MKILLVLPAVDHLRVTEDDPTVPKRSMLRFSILPLLVVAGLTPKEHQVVICDENVLPLDIDQDVDVVGISFMTALANRAYEIARAFRSRGRIVIAGGYHPTLCPEEAGEHFDSIVTGDAEGAWPELIRDIEQGEFKSLYRSDPECDLSATPAARRDLFGASADHYATTGAVQTGRGCAHRCRYCSIASFHQGHHRSRPLEQVLDEVRGVSRHFIFVDDNIIADPVYARSLFEALIPHKKRWVGQCSLKIADDPELLELARRSGCMGLFIGIESLSTENLAQVGKKFNVERDVEGRIRAIQRKGIGIVAGMIVGMDHDDKTVFERIDAFLQKTGIETLQLNIMTPLPGTPLFEEFAGKDRILDFDWSHYDFRHCVFQPALMSAGELQEGANWLYGRFYRLDRIVRRTVRSLFTSGWRTAVLTWRLNMTYRYDNKRESIRGSNPAGESKVKWLDRMGSGLKRGAVPGAIIPGQSAP